MFSNIRLVTSKILDFHSREYEEYGVMGPDAMYCHRQVLTFQRNLLPLSSTLKSKLGN
jgi:hypothetical protein